MPVLWEGKHPVYLLSDHVGIMARFHLERAIVCPQVDGGSDTGNTAFKYLTMSACSQFFALEHTISAASVPAIENSKSAYFFQYPNSNGNFARNRSYASRVVAIACGLELRFRPPSRVSAARTSFSQFSKLSVSSSYAHRMLASE